MQKKAYRVLEEMCGGESDECQSFVVANLETLKVVLLETLKNASSPAKRVRLLCREKQKIKQTLDWIVYLDLRRCVIASFYLYLFFLAETEVPDPHR